MCVLDQFFEFIVACVNKAQPQRARITLHLLKKVIMNDSRENTYDIDQAYTSLSALHAHMEKWFPITPLNPLEIPTI